MSSKRFPWIFTALWLLILLLMIWAGFWQLGRAQEKRVIKERMASGVDFRPTSISQWQGLQPFDAVTVEGAFSSLHLFQENQIMDGHVGYFIYSAFKTSEGLWVWVNRGWRDTASAEFEAENERSLSGLIGAWPRPGVQLGEQNIANAATQHVTYLPQEAVYALLKERLCKQDRNNDCIMLPVVIKLDPKAANGFVRKWQLPRMTTEKHQAYALQWFTMSLVLCILYFIFMKKHYSKKSNGS